MKLKIWILTLPFGMQVNSEIVRNLEIQKTDLNQR